VIRALVVVAMLAPAAHADPGEPVEQPPRRTPFDQGRLVAL
jgi:hypothetical protein